MIERPWHIRTSTVALSVAFAVTGCVYVLVRPEPSHALLPVTPAVSTSTAPGSATRSSRHVDVPTPSRRPTAATQSAAQPGDNATAAPSSVPASPTDLPSSSPVQSPSTSDAPTPSVTPSSTPPMLTPSG